MLLSVNLDTELHLYTVVFKQFHNYFPGKATHTIYSIMSYDTLSFLLDRANIEDVIRRLVCDPLPILEDWLTIHKMIYVDEHNFDGLISEVFHEEVLADYSLIFNKPPEKQSASAQTAEWRILVEQLDTSQHMASYDI